MRLFLISVAVLCVGAVGPVVSPGGRPGAEGAAMWDRIEALRGTARNAACCKRCSKGKPCGDSCIARDKSCRKGEGCAC